jgi:hypothetical protein
VKVAGSGYAVGNTLTFTSNSVNAVITLTEVGAGGELGTCRTCADGSFQANTGQASCGDVPNGQQGEDGSGTYAETGAITAVACVAGKYSTNGTGGCQNAGAGNVSSTSSTALQADSGATQQAACPAGSFKTETGAVSLLAQITSGGTGHDGDQDAVEYTPTVAQGSAASNTGSGAKLSVTTNNVGQITAVTVKVAGSGYAVGNTLTFTSNSVNAVITLTEVGAGGVLGTCRAADAGKVSSTSSTAVQVDTGADQQAACPQYKYKTGAGAVSLFGDLIESCSAQSLTNIQNTAVNLDTDTSFLKLIDLQGRITSAAANCVPGTYTNVPLTDGAR